MCCVVATCHVLGQLPNTSAISHRSVDWHSKWGAHAKANIVKPLLREWISVFDRQTESKETESRNSDSIDRIDSFALVHIRMWISYSSCIAISPPGRPFSTALRAMAKHTLSALYFVLISVGWQILYWVLDSAQLFPWIVALKPSSSSPVCATHDFEFIFHFMVVRIL